MAEKRARRAVAGCRRVVLKIGSKALATGDVFARVARDVGKALRAKAKRKRSVVIVSSGAIALGMEHLSMKARPKRMAGLQAAAAAGQSLLMQRWGEAFGKQAVAQVLLTHADLANRTRANNARAAVTKLLELNVVPIINENDAVAVDEIRFGDNDALAAMVTPLCDGELLLLLSDVPGVLDMDDERIPFLPTVDDDALSLVRRGGSLIGTGGMRSKLEAARMATLAGAHVVIADANAPNVLSRTLHGDDVGTLIPAVSRAMTNRKHWIAYTLRAVGTAIVDPGAAVAIAKKNKSVLCVGVIGIRGQFAPGDAISIQAPNGDEIARGLSRLSSADAARLAGDKGASELLVHRDDLVLLPHC